MKTTVIALLGLVCITSAIASADSIPISGEAFIGFAQFTGDFRLQGPGLALTQGTPGGPSFIGSCLVGTVCDFSFGIGSSAQFCYCTGLSGGSLGGQTADFLISNLTFTGSALYTGGDSITLPINVAGTIVGYKLDCTDPAACSLGPRVFTLKLVGQGEATAFIVETGLILGTDATFTGVATVVPEPASLLLMGTGLAGIVWRKYGRRQRAG